MLLHDCAALRIRLAKPIPSAQVKRKKQCRMKRTEHAGHRTPVKSAKRPEDEEADIEAQLDKERQEMLQNGQVASEGGGHAPGVETYVLKVTCKHGSVQIRQRKDDNFVTLHDKFRKYAIEQRWATESTNLHLTCDDEDVDVKANTPDDFDLEDGMTIDVVIK